jgi:hypothetical protein
MRFASSLLTASILLAAVWLVAGGRGAVTPQTTASIGISPAAAEPVLAKAASETQVQRVARRGTRNYYAGDGEALTVPTTPSTETAASGHDPIKECVDVWDAATHITKSKWREICVRQIRERGDVHSALDPKTQDNAR